jgi:hypothetical protein
MLRQQETSYACVLILLYHISQGTPMCWEKAQTGMLHLLCSDKAFTSEQSSNNSASAIERSGWLFWVDNLTANGLRERLCMVYWEKCIRKELCLF